MKQKILFGTYTDDPTYDKPNKSKGIYRGYLDDEDKHLENIELVIEETNPTYIVKDDKNGIYAATGIKRMGGVGSYTSERILKDRNYQHGSIAHLSYDKQRKFLYAANYHNSQIEVFYMTDDNKLKLLSSTYHTEQTGPHPNQDSSHVHYVGLTPDDFLISCDLGTDTVYCYKVLADGNLEKVSSIRLSPGTGPRHLVFHPNGNYLYVVGELNSSVNVLTYNKHNQQLEFVTSYHTIPEDYDGFNSGSAIRIDEEGKHLYVSNRGANTIVMFNVEDNGKTLNFVQSVDTMGNFPRDFDLDPTGNFLVVGHQYSDNVSLFEIDQEYGTLQFLETAFCPECVCVSFDK